MSGNFKIVETVTLAHKEIIIGTSGRRVWRPEAEVSVHLEGNVTTRPVITSWGDTSLSEAEADVVARAARWNLARKLAAVASVEATDFTAVRTAEGWRSTVRWALADGPDVTVTVPSYGSREDARDAARQIVKDATIALSPAADDPIRTGEGAPLPTPHWFGQLTRYGSVFP
ncbi:hypothetical protein J2847_006442 [Azospirillum agricola]|uniref:hypothetical protein n=1 Tax=Azospirillum agricola TaxID=1720247 RepID=UPI001AE6ABBC|nr:hypothetical protein [Azospirillum agricola]MBP2233107.1 hypothetical protein [Azospirillum agricola]